MKLSHIITCTLLYAMNLSLYAGCCLQYFTTYDVPASSGNVSRIAVSPNGSYLASSNWNPPQSSTVTIFNLTGTFSANSYPIPHGTAGDNTPLAIQFSPNGSFLATANTSNDITIFQVSAQGVLSGAVSYPMGTNCCSSLVFTPDSSHIAVLGTGSNSVIMCAISGTGVITGSTSYTLPTGATSPQALAISPNGSLLATCNGSGNVTLFKLSNGVLSGGTNTATSSDGANGITFSPDGTLLAVANNSTFGSGNISLFGVSGGALSAVTNYALPSGSHGPTDLAFSPDNACLVVSNGGDFSSNNLNTFTVSGGTLTNATAFTVLAGYPVFFGSYLATGGGNGPVVFLNTFSEGTCQTTTATTATGTTATQTTTSTTGSSDASSISNSLHLLYKMRSLFQ